MNTTLGEERLIFRRESSLYWLGATMDLESALESVMLGLGFS